MIIIANFLICRVIYVCTRTMRNVMTSSRVDPRHLKKKILIPVSFNIGDLGKKKERKKRMKIRNNFFRCPDIHIHIRIAILPSSYNLRYCIARMRFLFISLDVKASF